jgi:hypothetical protein
MFDVDHESVRLGLLWAAGICLVAGLVLARAAYRRSRETHIWIANPADGASVTWKYVVTGTVRPPNRGLRLFVLSVDGEWHVQPKPLVKHGRWRCICYFGREDTLAGEQFELIAVDAAFAPKATDLPLGGAKSRVTVYRG